MTNSPPKQKFFANEPESVYSRKQNILHRHILRLTLCCSSMARGKQNFIAGTLAIFGPWKRCGGLWGYAAAQCGKCVVGDVQSEKESFYVHVTYGSILILFEQRIFGQVHWEFPPVGLLGNGIPRDLSHQRLYATRRAWCPIYPYS